jgi:hypothetical protein
MIREITKEDLKGYGRSGFLTVKYLKKFLEEHALPDDAIVLIQRVEDVYYEKNGWGVYKKDGEWVDYANKYSPDISPEELDEFKEQYHPAWCCVFYHDDPDMLFIDLHY